MSSGPSPVGNPGDSADAGKQMLTGWRHLQNTLGGTFNASVKRSRKLARARLRGKG